MLTLSNATCPRCQQPAGDGKFCSNCGSPLLPTCPSCGHQLSATDRFCSACGHGREPGQPKPEPEQSQDPDLLVWSLSVPMLTGRFFLKDLVKMFVAIIVVLSVVMGLMGLAAGEPDTLLKVAPLFAVVLGVLFVLIGLVSLLFFGNRYQALYQVSPEGAAFLAGTRERALGQFAVVASILSGSTRAMASSLLAQAGETVTITWKNVHRVKVYPHEKVVALADSWHTVLRLHCPEDRFEEVVQKVRQYAADGASWRADHGVKTGGGVLPILGWMALVALGTLLGLVYDPKTNDVGFMVVLTGMFLAVAGLLPGILHRGLGVFALLSGLVALGHRVVHALDAYRVEEAWTSTAGCALLVALALYQIFRSDRKGRETAVFDSDSEA